MNEKTLENKINDINIEIDRLNVINMDRNNINYLKGQLIVYKEWLEDLKKQNNYKVEIIESEKGFGQRIDEVIFFPNEESALNYVKEYNKQNNKSQTPDWYMFANYIGFCWNKNK